MSETSPVTAPRSATWASVRAGARAVRPSGWVAIIAVTLSASGALRAAEPDAAIPAPSSPRIVLVTMRSCCAGLAAVEVELALAAELRVFGCEVLEARGVASDERERRIELGVVAEEHAAQAAVRVLRAGGSDAQVEMWTGPEGRGSALFRRLSVHVGDPRDGARLVALKVAEMLRVRIESAAAPAAPPSPNGLAVADTGGGGEEPAAPDSSPQIVSTVGPVWSRGAGAIDGQLGGAGSLTWRLEPHLALALALELGLLSPGRRVKQGGLVASLWAGDARLWASWVVSSGVVDGEIVAGAGVQVTHLAGEPATGVVARDVTTASGYVGAGVRALVWLTPRLGVAAGATLGWLAPAPVVRFMGREVATLGRPALEVGTSLVVRVL